MLYGSFYHYELQWSPFIKGNGVDLYISKCPYREGVPISGWPYEGFHCTLSFSLHRNP